MRCVLAFGVAFAALTGLCVPAHAQEITAAVLEGPTDRYRHGVFGEKVERETLTVTVAGGAAPLSVTLPPDLVFEDRLARIADANSDGVRDEIVVVEADLKLGGALAVWGVRDGTLKRLTRTDFIGIRNRWMNPGEIADLDGDGRNEITHVRTPHIGGTVEIWEMRGSDAAGWKLVREGRLDGFSSHAYQTLEQDLTEAFDWDGDGILDLLVPDISRRTVVVLSFAGGTLREVGRVDLPGRITGALRAEADGTLTVGIDSGARVPVMPGR